MGIKRYLATSDSTITDAYKFDNITRATGSNIGLADSLEVFSLFGNASTGSVEKSRILVEFPITSISTDRSSGIIPASGSVDFVLKLYNVRHHETVPKNFTLMVAPVSQSWDEGHGLDLDNYTDRGYGYQGLGVNWIYASSSSVGLTAWTAQGGDFLSSPLFSQSFDLGTENLSVTITPLVEEWIAETITNNGVGIYLTSSQENAASSSVSYFTKKFSARGSEYWHNRPIIEARWDSTKKDNRGNFILSSSNLSAADNLNTVYFYNYVRGQLKDLPTIGTGAAFVRFFESGSGGTELSSSVTPSYPITGGWVETGVYSASFACNWTGSLFYEKWFATTSGTTCFHTGTIIVEDRVPSNVNTLSEYVLNISNFKNIYRRDERARLRVFTRERNWCPNIYSKAQASPILSIIENVYYRIVRLADNFQVLEYLTGSTNNDATRLSYDISGSYFDLDMSILQEDFGYGVQFLYSYNDQYVEYPKVFKFRVEK